MVMVGAGALAPFLIRAHAAERPLTHIALWNHRPERAASLAAELAAEGLPVRPAGDLEAEIRQADVVSCATLTSEPLVRGEWLRAGTSSRLRRGLQALDARDRRFVRAAGDAVLRHPGGSPEGGR